MEPIFLYVFLGVLGFPFLLYGWERLTGTRQEEVLPLFCLNLLLYGIRDAWVLLTPGVEEWGLEKGSPGHLLFLLGESCVGFGFYYFYASVFLAREKLGIRGLFLIVQSVVFVPAVRYLTGEEDPWRSSSFFFALAIWFWVGVVFGPRTFSERESSSWDGFLWVGGLVSLGLLQAPRIPAELGNLPYLFARLFWVLAIAVFVSWTASALAYGKGEFLGAIGGAIAFGSAVPEEPSFLIVAGFLVGIVPGALAGVWKRSQAFLSIAFGGFGWGGFVGFVLAPLLNGWEGEFALVWERVGERALSLLGILLATMLVGLLVQSQFGRKKNRNVGNLNHPVKLQ